MQALTTQLNQQFEENSRLEKNIRNYLGSIGFGTI
jgi:hypothetical protein